MFLGTYDETGEFNADGLSGEWLSPLFTAFGDSGIFTKYLQIVPENENGFRHVGWLYLLRATVPGTRLANIGFTNVIVRQPTPAIPTLEPSEARGHQILFMPRQGLGSYRINRSGNCF